MPEQHHWISEEDGTGINIEFLAGLTEADFDQVDRIMTALAGRTGFHPVDLMLVRYGRNVGATEPGEVLNPDQPIDEWLPKTATAWLHRGRVATLVRLEAWRLSPRTPANYLTPDVGFGVRRPLAALQAYPEEDSAFWGDNFEGKSEHWRDSAYDPFQGYSSEPEEEPAEAREIPLAERLKSVPAPPAVWAALELLAGGVPRTGLPVDIPPDAENVLTMNEFEFDGFGSICDVHPMLRDAADNGDVEVQRELFIVAINTSLKALAHLILEFQISNWRLRNRLEQAFATELRALLEAYADTF